MSTRIQMWIKTSDRLPRSGVPVLAYATNAYNSGQTHRLIAFYAPEKFLEMHEDWEDENSYDEESGCYYSPAGWYEQNEFGEYFNRVNGDVTDWMVIPDAPLKMQETSDERTVANFVGELNYNDILQIASDWDNSKGIVGDCALRNHTHNFLRYTNHGVPSEQDFNDAVKTLTMEVARVLLIQYSTFI